MKNLLKAVGCVNNLKKINYNVTYYHYNFLQYFLKYI